jgi:hypothetical protein
MTSDVVTNLQSVNHKHHKRCCSEELKPQGSIEFQDVVALVSDVRLVSGHFLISLREVRLNPLGNSPTNDYTVPGLDDR